MTTAHWKAALGSCARVAVAVLAGAVYTVWTASPTHDLSTRGAWVSFASAVGSAVLLTVFNALRSGDTRFGLGAAPETADDEADF